MAEVLSIDGHHVITAASVEAVEEPKQLLGVSRIQLVIADMYLTPGPQAWADYA
jgi:hypothetical protein